MERRGVQPNAGALLLGDGKETGGFDGIREKDGGRNSNEERENTFDDEDPLWYMSVMRKRMIVRRDLPSSPRALQRDR